MKKEFIISCSVQFTWLDAKLHLRNENLIKYLFQSPPLHLLQIEGILHLRSQMSKTYTALQNLGFPQPACLLTKGSLYFAVFSHAY